MAKRCIYCSEEIQDSAIDICKPCGIQAWGEKMFEAIQENTQKAQEAGDLIQTGISQSN